MGYLCQFCERPFSRSYNRDRHERQGCFKRLDETSNQNSMGIKRPRDIFDEAEKEEEEDYDHEEDEQEDPLSNEDDVEEDHESSTDSETEKVDRPWKKLRLEVIDELSSDYDEQVERFQNEGVPKDVAEAKASNYLLPAYRKKLRGLYVHYLKWIRNLKNDRIHKEIMATLRRYMDDDDMDFEEAVEAAVDKRKFLLNRIFKPVEIPEDSSDQEEDDVVRHRVGNEWPSG